MFFNYSALRRTPKKPITEGGFTLVELMISISIMVIVASIILTRQTAFNGAVLLRSQAYEVALQVRAVQLNAVSAGAVADTNVFRSVQGVSFDAATSSNSQYRIFRDGSSGQVGFYDSGEAFGIQGLLDKRFEIRAVRAVGDTITGTEVSVVFVRPNFDARFFDSTGELNASSVEVDIARKGITGTGEGVLRTLEITSTGQITVQ